jgi:hypothetical protein
MRRIAGWKNDTPLYCEEIIEIEETEPALQKHTEWKLLITGGYALISTEREVLLPKLINYVLQIHHNPTQIRRAGAPRRGEGAVNRCTPGGSAQRT